MVKFLKDRMKQAVRDLNECRDRINSVFNYIDEEVLHDDTRMDAYFDALYNMMEKKGYNQDEVDYISENE